MDRRSARWSVTVLSVVGVAGCGTLFPTEAPGPQRVLVRDLQTNTPIAGVEVAYEFRSFGPRASIRRDRRGQIEVEPLLQMPDVDQPLSRPLPGEDLEEVWAQYNEPADRGPVFNPDGSFNTSSFRERTIRRTALSAPDGYALLPIIHAPIRFRECQLTASKPGYRPVTTTVRVADLDSLSEKGRTIQVYLSPVGAAAE